MQGFVLVSRLFRFVAIVIGCSVLFSCQKADKDNTYIRLIRNDYNDVCSGNYYKKVFQVSPRLAGKYLGTDGFLFMEQAWATKTDINGFVEWVRYYSHREEKVVIGNDGYFFIDNNVLFKFSFDDFPVFQYAIAMDLELLEASINGGVFARSGSELLYISPLGVPTTLVEFESGQTVNHVYLNYDDQFVILLEQDEKYKIRKRDLIGSFDLELGVSLSSPPVDMIESTDGGTAIVTQDTENKAIRIHFLNQLLVNTATKSYSMPENTFKGKSLVPLADDGYMLVVETRDLKISKDRTPMQGQINLFRLDKNGGLQWKEEFGSSGEDNFLSMSEESDGSLMLLVNTQGYDGNSTQEYFRASVTRLDANGKTCY